MCDILVTAGVKLQFGVTQSISHFWLTLYLGNGYSGRAKLTKNLDLMGKYLVYMEYF